MASIGELVISLGADIASFRSSMEEANSHLDTLKKQSSDTAQVLKQLSSAFETVASVEAVRRIADFGAELVESAARVQELTRALGVNAEQYQVLGYAAQRAGVPSDVFARSMETLARNIDLVSTGGAASAAKVFAELGLSVHNADGSMRSAGDVLEDLAHNKIFQAESEAQKFAQVMILMGARGGDAGLVVNALNGNLRDFAGAAKQATDAGLVLDEQTLKGAEEMETKFTAIWTRLKNTLTEGIVTAFKNPLGSLMGEWKLPPEPTSQQPKTQPPGPAVVDPTQAKQLENFNETYRKLLSTEQEDADFQNKLRAAYQESAGAVAQVMAAHAADRAQLELLQAAQRDHVKATQAEINAVRDAAAANALATRSAEEQKAVIDALAEARKKDDDAIRKVMDETDGLTEKQQKLADALGVLEQELLSGAISWDEYAQRAKAAQQLLDGAGADKGMLDFAKSFSSDLDTLLGKMTDFNAIMEKADEKGKGRQSVFQQFTQDADQFIASLEKMLLKLLLIDPLLNSLGLGNEGNGKQLPTLGGGGGAGLFSNVGSVVVGAGAGNQAGGGVMSSVLSFFKGLFGGVGGTAASDANASAGVSLNSDIMDAFNDFGIPGFATGGDFVVGGVGGVDSQLVSFRATPGERVSVMSDVAAAARSRGADASTGRGNGGTTITMNVSGVHADTFRATQDHIMGDLIRGISAGRRYA